MSDLDFFVESAIDGKVLSVGVGASPTEVEECLGTDYIDDHQRRLFRRDYGLVEFFFERVGKNWICRTITIQVHRLAYEGAEAVPLPLQGTCGLFSRFIAYNRLESAIKTLGFRVAPVVSDPASDFRKVKVEEIESEIVIVDDCSSRRGVGPGYNDIWSISLVRTRDDRCRH